MRVREALEPETGRWGLLGQGEHSLGCGVVDNVELVVELQNHSFVWRTGIDIGDILRSRLAETGQCRSLPIITTLPNVPGAIRIKTFQWLCPNRDRRIEVNIVVAGRVPAH